MEANVAKVQEDRKMEKELPSLSNLSQMRQQPEYPPIDPTTFDLIVVGTGLPESVIAAAASSAGKTVLHLDPNPFYGSHYSSLYLSDLSAFLLSHPLPPPEPSSSPLIHIQTRPLYSGIEILSSSPELEGQSGKFLLDISGPRALLCADKAIELLIKSGASNYVEFKGVEASFLFLQGRRGKLCKVPDSRAAIFKDKGLSLTEKNQLMRFFKLVQAHLGVSVAAGSEGGKALEEEDGGKRKILDEDLERPFVDFLSKMKLPRNIKSIILYAIAMADYDQEDKETCKDLLRTKDGIDRLAIYQSSIGRFSNTLGAMIYPIYGQGELAQAFCRRAAVKGCIYVLRMPVIALLTEENDGGYKGVRLASGQDIYSRNLVMDPSFTIPSHLASSSDELHERLHFDNTLGAKTKVARGICITRGSLSQDVSNLLVVFPPRSLFSEQVTSVRALQISGNLAVCPHGMFVLYLSALCENIDDGKKLLNAAIDAVLSSPDSANPENPEDVKPALLWRALFMQDLTTAQFGPICSTPMPDGHLTHSNLLDVATELFQKIYPGEAFFAETAMPEDSDD